MPLPVLPTTGGVINPHFYRLICFAPSLVFIPLRPISHPQHLLQSLIWCYIVQAGSAAVPSKRPHRPSLCSSLSQAMGTQQKPGWAHIMDGEPSPGLPLRKAGPCPASYKKGFKIFVLYLGGACMHFPSFMEQAPKICYS